MSDDGSNLCDQCKYPYIFAAIEMQMAKDATAYQQLESERAELNQQVADISVVVEMEHKYLKLLKVRLKCWRNGSLI